MPNMLAAKAWHPVGRIGTYQPTCSTPGGRRPATPQSLRADYTLGDADLLGASCVGGIASTAMLCPCRGLELEPAEVSVAGADRPVASRFALRNGVPIDRIGVGRYWIDGMRGDRERPADGDGGETCRLPSSWSFPDTGAEPPAAMWCLSQHCGHIALPILA